MTNITVTTPNPVHSDDRGSITDVINTKDPFHHIGHITFTKGAVRANHYHEFSDQYDYITKGSFEFATKPANEEGAEVKKCIVKEGDLVFIPKKTIHAYKALEESSLLDITTSSREGSGYESDTVRVDPII